MLKIIKLCTLVILTLNSLHASPIDEIKRVTPKQHEVLTRAFNYGLNHKFNDGHLGYILASIAWIESRAGTNTGANKKGHKSFGVFQNYVVTVKTRMERMPDYPPSVTHAYVKQQVESNFETSARFAVIELSEWNKVRKGDMFKTLASYNAGYNISKGYSYANLVMKQAEYFKNVDYFGYESKSKKESLCQTSQSHQLNTLSLALHQKLKNVRIVSMQSDYLSNVVNLMQFTMNTLMKPSFYFQDYMLSTMVLHHLKSKRIP